MKRVIFLHQGAELYGSDLIFAQVLSEVAGCVKAFVVLDGNGPLVERLKAIEGLVVHIHPLGVLRRKHMGIRGLFGLTREIIRAVSFLVHLIRKENVGLVYTNTIGIIAGMFAAALCRVSHITHVHEIITQPKIVARVLASLVKTMSQTVIAVSGPVKSFLDESSACRRENVKIIHNGISTTKFDQAKRGAIRREFGVNDDVFLIAMVGRLHFWKGQDVLIKAGAILRERGLEGFHVMLFGDVFSGYEYIREQLETLVHENGLEKKVTSCGFRNDTANLLVDADVVVVPSTLPDPLPTVVLEGMAAKKPVIGTAHGGITEMILDGQTGFLVRPGSSEDLAMALLRLAQDRELCLEMGQAGRQRLEEFFSTERFAQEIRLLVCFNK